MDCKILGRKSQTINLIKPNYLQILLITLAHQKY